MSYFFSENAHIIRSRHIKWDAELLLHLPVLGTTSAGVCLPDAAFSAQEGKSLTTDSIALFVQGWE